MEAVTTILNGYRLETITAVTWEAILRLIWQVVEPAAYEVAKANRDYYDEEYAKAFPGAARHQVYLTVPKYEHFVQDMERYKAAIMAQDTGVPLVHEAALRAVRTVENAGRRTMIRAVEDLDEEDILADSHDAVFAADDAERKARLKEFMANPNTVKGWARVPTGRETCSWCLMLCSRPADGPNGYGAVLYSSFETAGGKGAEREALMNHANGRTEKVSMDSWHTGCDCKVVPVFNLQQWEGKELAEGLYKLWAKATKGESGKDALNAFRRAVYAGDHKPLFNKHRAALAA